MDTAPSAPTMPTLENQQSKSSDPYSPWTPNEMVTVTDVSQVRTLRDDLIKNVSPSKKSSRLGTDSLDLAERDLSICHQEEIINLNNAECIS